MHSFFSRLKVIKFLFFNDRLCASNYRNLNLVFSLRKRLFSKKLSSIYVSKFSGNSFIFRFPDFYERSFLLLLSLYTLPFFEKFRNRFSYLYRPFRLYNDIFYFFKKDPFFHHSSTYYYSSIDFSINYNSFFYSLFFPLKDSEFLSFFHTQFWSKYFDFEDYNIYHNFINFSFIGLVRVI